MGNDTVLVPLPHVQWIDRASGMIVLIPSILADTLGAVSEEITLTLKRPRTNGARPESWLTLSDAAERHVNDVDGLNTESARKRVRKAGLSGEFETNGKSGRELRIDPTSFGAWRLRQREADLRRRDEGED
jgi:hypothetical protein